jgi:hypothetical protein
VARKIESLELRVAEPFLICKRWNGQKSQPVRWDVWRAAEGEQVRAAEEMTVETPLEAELKASIAYVNSQKKQSGDGTLTVAAPPVDAGTANVAGAKTEPPRCSSPKTERPGNGKILASGKISEKEDTIRQRLQIQKGWAEFLLFQTDALIDVFAAALGHAGEKHGNAVKPEDVRALMTTAFINLSQKGGLTRV